MTGRIPGRSDVTGLTIKHKKINKIENRKRVYFEAINTRMKTFTHKSIQIFALETAGGIILFLMQNHQETATLQIMEKNKFL